MSDFALGIKIPEPDINESGEFFAALADRRRRHTRRDRR